MKKLMLMMLCGLALPAFWAGAAEEKVLKMSTTTSTQASGLLDVLLPELEKDTGIKVKVIAKGTGAAIRDGMDGNVDVIFVHARAKEDEFVAKGFGTQRYAVMHNDFIIVGPPSDPAGIKGLAGADLALKKIASAKQLFISRGDDSGTHTKEQEIWQATGLPLSKKVAAMEVKGEKKEITFVAPADADEWYRSIGQGMDKTLTFADEKKAYTLSDRGTYINFRYGREIPLELAVLSEGDAKLANPYGVIPVNPAKFPHVKHAVAKEFAEWLVSPRGQAVIAGYKIHGQQLFFPDAVK